MTGDNDRTASVITKTGRRDRYYPRSCLRIRPVPCRKAAGHTVIMLGGRHQRFSPCPPLTSALRSVTAPPLREIADITIAADSLRASCHRQRLQSAPKANYRLS